MGELIKIQIFRLLLEYINLFSGGSCGGKSMKKWDFVEDLYYTIQLIQKEFNWRALRNIIIILMKNTSIEGQTSEETLIRRSEKQTKEKFNLSPKELLLLPKSEAFQQIFSQYKLIFNQALLNYSQAQFQQLHEILELLDYAILSCTPENNLQEVLCSFITLVLEQINSILTKVIYQQCFSFKICIKLLKSVLIQMMEIIASSCLIKQKANWNIYSVLMCLLMKMCCSSNKIFTFSQKNEKQMNFLKQLKKFSENLSIIAKQKNDQINVLHSEFIQYPVNSYEEQPLLWYFCLALKNFVNDRSFTNINCPFLVDMLGQKINACTLVINSFSHIITFFDEELSYLSNKNLEEIAIWKIKTNLQWICLILNICQSPAVTYSQNSHKLFQYIIDFSRYLHKYELSKTNHSKYSIILQLYISQLLSMCIFRNPHSVAQYCRKQNFFDEIVGIWKEGFMKICSNQQQRQKIISENGSAAQKRMMLGLFGLMSLDSFENFLSETIKNSFSICIKVIQLINDNDTQSLHSNQSEPEASLQQFWDEQLEYKNKSQLLEQTNQIQQLKHSLKHLNTRNPELFQHLIQNFTAQEIILWTLQLEQKNEDL